MHPLDAFVGSRTIPLFVLVAYQMMFAQITPALITGAFANRVRFQAYLIFLVGWLLFVYFPMVHMVWGGGLLAKWGVLDFAGGIVVHCIAGFAALASVMFVGRRKVHDPGPHSIPLVALGTGLLWFGWYGFNAGSELRVDAVTALAFLNTDVAASFAAIVWLIMAWRIEKKPKFVGLLTGSIAGLAAVTPAAGYVSTPVAVLIGILASIICYFAVNLKNRLKWDDALDVWGVHGVGGVVGVICLGIFANLGMNDAGANGLIHGNPALVGIQLLAIVVTITYSFGLSFIILKLLDKVMGLRVDDESEQIGLDLTEHGEAGYVW
jgi:Amt family ammonium transporter